jgi:putrescine transport system substrate-binding protein
MRWLVALGLLLLLPCTAVAEERVLNVYNWTDYIDPYAISRFERETGVHVHYDVYDSLETLEGKLLAGHSGYDVVVPTSEPTFSRLIRDGALLPLDRAKIPNMANLDPALMQRVASSDPANRFGAIYLWGTIGLGIIPARLPADLPRNSWDLLFKPEYAKRAAGCGITMLDSAIDVIPTTLKYLGHDPNSTDAADLADVQKTLLAIRPYIRNFASGGALEALAAGETCLAMDYSGDVIQAATRAAEAGHAPVIYVAPKEGAQLWFDMLAIPADAPHPAEAAAFINFVLQPQVMAGISRQVHYPDAMRAEAASRPEFDPNWFTIGPVPQAAERARNRAWARFKAGK